MVESYGCGGSYGGCPPPSEYPMESWGAGDIIGVAVPDAGPIEYGDAPETSSVDVMRCNYCVFEHAS